MPTMYPIDYDNLHKKNSIKYDSIKNNLYFLRGIFNFRFRHFFL